ncbi:MAG: hypothetical protein EZS28_002650 [Streblomastix strix]|uniref:Uncharacterized protein n=1 Tax=Streblomastix strix TaxID=222440 RepID=A0A5J4X3P6_9EUKA|nr:MAG: hypothetical protein EZS28_002650 [Streblomastix strix]
MLNLLGNIEYSAHNGVKPRDKLIDVIQILETNDNYYTAEKDPETGETKSLPIRLSQTLLPTLHKFWNIVKEACNAVYFANQRDQLKQILIENKREINNQIKKEEEFDENAKHKEKESLIISRFLRWKGQYILYQMKDKERDIDEQQIIFYEQSIDKNKAKDQKIKPRSAEYGTGVRGFVREEEEKYPLFRPVAIKGQ